MLNLCFAVSATLLTLIAIWSWRNRSTPIGRGMLAYVVSADLWALTHLPIVEEVLGAAGESPFSRIFAIAAGSLLLRLALLATDESGRLPRHIDALLLAGSLAVFAAGDVRIAALWISLAAATAGLRMSGLTQRSWDGFRAALNLVVGSMLLIGVLPALWLARVAPEVVVASAPLVCTLAALALCYGLPRLGLLSSDRVQHSRVIQAMSDGVLVVDLNGRLVDFNEAASQILDLDDRDHRSQPLSEALAHHPDLVELFDGAIDGRSVYSPEASRATSAEGESRTYDLQLSALYDAAGAIQSRVVVLRDISDRIAIERDNRRQARHVRLVHEVSARVHEADTIEAGLESALSLIGRTMELPLGHFLRATLDPDGASRLIASGIHYAGMELDLIAEEAGLELGPAEGETNEEHAAALREIDPRGMSWWKQLGLECAISVPVMIGQRLYGMFELFSREPIEVEESTTEMLEHVGELVGRAVERKLAEEKIRRLAFRDDLTGLPNRQRFHHLLRGAVALAARSRRRMALLFLDLDGFKKVNDTLGHEVGDLLLAEVAVRFAGVVRVSDHIARQGEDAPESAVSRLGGDEFTVLLTDVNRPEDAALVAERLVATLERPIALAGRELFMSTSIGISVFPEDGEDAESLLRNADAAMYFAKGRGRNGFQFYSEEMNRTRSTQIEIEARLRGALEREEFQLYYQPLLDAESGEVVAAEALLRWIDAERGFVPPDEFVPVAEETGLIVSIGQWVFRTACEQAQRWRDELGLTVRIGVNVSGHQIREPGMVAMVRSAIAETGVDPEQVELELTESTIMQDDALTVQTLRELREMGIGLALDDFGTGYSSLSYLRRFTIDRVKIDRSFVSELPDNADDAALTAAIIAMAHGLRLRVVAEGVETAAQGLFLRQRGCDELQGYFFGRPVPAEEFVDRLRAAPAVFDAPPKDADDADDLGVDGESG